MSEENFMNSATILGTIAVAVSLIIVLRDSRLLSKNDERFIQLGTNESSSKADLISEISQLKLANECSHQQLAELQEENQSLREELSESTPRR
jgi:alpha-tubulin suppressor-like RCC1 family protein